MPCGRARSSGSSARTARARPPPWRLSAVCAGPMVARCGCWGSTRSVTPASCAGCSACSCSAVSCRTGSGCTRRWSCSRPSIAIRPTRPAARGVGVGPQARCHVRRAVGRAAAAAGWSPGAGGGHGRLVVRLHHQAPGPRERPADRCGVRRRAAGAAGGAGVPVAVLRLPRPRRVRPFVRLPARAVAVRRRRRDRGADRVRADRRQARAPDQVDPAGAARARRGQRGVDRRVHLLRGTDRAAVRAPPAGDLRAGTGQPAPRRGAGGERRAAGATAGPGQGGGHDRRAAADGPGDPRHARPGPHRDRRPARGG